MNLLRRILICALALSLLAPTALALDGVNYSYTYTYDYWALYQASPDAYSVAKVIRSVDLGLDTPIRNPQGMFVRGSDIYLCDTNNNRVLQITRNGNQFSLTRIISDFSGGEPNTFSAPTDVYVNEAGELYICDTNNNRVLHLTSELSLLNQYTKPDDATFDQKISFLPTKVTSDTSGRVFVLARNVNKGVIKFEPDGEFTGFIGASPVRFDWINYIWKMLSTREQRAQQEAFVPTEYDNLYMDNRSFIYCVTTTFSEYDLMSDVAKPIRKINAIGNDILVKNGNYLPIGDLDWGVAGEISGPTKFVDVTVLSNGVYVGIDRTRGRLFGYDEQGRMLWAFGGIGNIEGYFLRPSAIEHMGEDLLVLDATECSITVFTPTHFGDLIYRATDQYMIGDYTGSADTWREVLKLNGNFDLAYVGIGRSLLRQDDFKGAMDCFSHVRDRENYSEAFRLYRKEWVEQNAIALFGCVFALLIVPLIIGKYRKIKREVEAYDHGVKSF